MLPNMPYKIKMSVYEYTIQKQIIPPVFYFTFLKLFLRQNLLSFLDGT